MRWLLALSAGLVWGILVLAPNTAGQESTDGADSRGDRNEATVCFVRGLELHEKQQYAAAIGEYTKAIHFDKKHIDSYNNRGLAWLETGSFDKAIADFTEAIRLDRKFAASFYNRGLAWLAKGEPDQAIKDFNDDIRLRPKHGPGYVHRGNAWTDKGKYEQAIADFEEAMRLDPIDPWARDRQAWLRATCPVDKLRIGKKDVELATRACELSKWDDTDFLNTLAASLAESGLFAEAARRQRESLDRLPPDSPDRQAFLDRLHLYQNGQGIQGCA